MAKISFTGLDSYMEKLQKLGQNADEFASKAIYEAAGIVADEIRSGIDSLDVNGEENATKYEVERREKQKQGLIESFGIANAQNDNGFINVKVGFEGYNQIKTPKYPRGQPNKMVARIFNSGTSYNRKQPFFDTAVRISKKRAQLKMKEVFESEIEKTIKE